MTSAITRGREPSEPLGPADVAAVQRRVLGTLVGTQILGGVGMASGIAVMALLARRLSGSDELAGFGTTFQVLGSAVIAVPVAQVMAWRGRRPGLVLGYFLALTGAALVVVAAMIGSFALMLVGALLFGGGTTSGNQARFAGADLSLPHRRGRDLSFVVWAATIGSVAGPNLVGPAERLGSFFGLPALAGSFVIAMAGFAAAVVVLLVWLRPDPLLVARRLSAGGAAAGAAKSSLREGVRIVRGHPQAIVGLVTMALGHAVMIAVMVMTPLHMDHGGATLNLIGLVISIHILGMYAFSPLTGWAVDRLGGRPVAVLGAGVLIVACVLAGLSPDGMSVVLTSGLFLLGLGWSCTLVSGSALLVGALQPEERAICQGVSDLVMGLCGAGGGAVAGVVLQHFGYSALAWGACGLPLLLAGVVAAERRGSVRSGSTVR